MSALEGKITSSRPEIDAADVAGLHGLRATTRERGGDDGKLFPSSQSVNYSFHLIRL